VHNNKLNILCLDIEGGHGGSSRSLFESVNQLTKLNEIKITVWCKSSGEIHNKYHQIGVDTKIVPNMPKVRAVPRFSRNVLLLLVFVKDWYKSKKFRNELLNNAKKFDLIHCNHEGLYWLSFWIKKHIKVPLTLHKRTNPWPSIFSRLQTKIIDYSVDNVVFITENERENFIRLGGSNRRSDVIHNIVKNYKNTIKPLDCLSQERRFKVCVLANYSYMRGIDRLICIAKYFREIGHHNTVFVVAGDISLTCSLPGELGQVAKRGGSLSDYAEECGVKDMFIFLGHTSVPERVLSGCHALISPSRENNPWGRDVLEALSFGLPVIATGTYNKFVETGVTGFLFNEFNAQIFARCIIKMSQDRSLVSRIGKKGKSRVQKLCNASDCAQDLLKFWRNAIKQ
jgi:glycosyltransferase involved in cell wall biosynthesis